MSESPAMKESLQIPDEEKRDVDRAIVPPLRIRYRIRFAKRGLLRWISHRDLARLWERLVRRAALVLSMTEGFHPKPRIAFPSALALGTESLNEVVELELAELLDPDELFARLSADDQPGLTINSVVQLPEGFGKAQLAHSEYLITTPETFDADQTSSVNEAINRLLATETVSVARKKNTLQFKVASEVISLKFDDQGMHLSLAASDAASMRPNDVLDLLGFGDWIENGAKMTRTKVVLQKEFETTEHTAK